MGTEIWSNGNINPRILGEEKNCSREGERGGERGGGGRGGRKSVNTGMVHLYMYLLAHYMDNERH